MEETETAGVMKDMAVFGEAKVPEAVLVEWKGVARLRVEKLSGRS